MVRVVLYSLGFLTITGLLIALQPGVQGPDASGPPSASVEAPPNPATAPDAPAIVTQARTAPAPALPKAPPAPDLDSRNTAAFPAMTLPQAARADDPDLHRITWAAIAQINAVTGRKVAPGQPGSLLHAVVQKSLAREAPGARAATPRGDSYIVAPGDSLASIAEDIYGDATMTGPLYAANAIALSDPRDLRPGQVLRLPAR